MKNASASTRESLRAGDLLNTPVAVETTTLPPISVVITGHERTAYLPEAVESVRAQNYPAPIEIVVVDDGSSIPLEETLGDVCPEVRWVRQTNQGVCAARDRGTREATHEFIAHLDDDDLCHPDRLRIQAEFLVDHPDVDFVCCDLRHNNEPPTHPGFFVRRGFHQCDAMQSYRIAPGEWVYPQNVLLESMFRQLPFFPSMLMARKSSSLRIGGWNASARLSGDCHDYFLRANHLGVIAFLEEPLTILRRGHGEHLTSVPTRAVMHEGIQLCRLVRQYPEELQQRIRPGFASFIAGRARKCYNEGRVDIAGMLYRRAAKSAVGLSSSRIKWTIAATGLTILNTLKRGKGARAIEAEFLDPIGGTKI